MGNEFLANFREWRLGKLPRKSPSRIRAGSLCLGPFQDLFAISPKQVAGGRMRISLTLTRSGWLTA